MKRIMILAFAALLVCMFSVPVMAMQHEFGGYWRTRAYTNQNFTGEDETDAMDWTGVDQRTRLYYTAVFHENLKFVNKFEFDGHWGSNSGSRASKAAGNHGFAQIGADGANIEIKNSYADFNLGALNAKVGVHYFELARGFLFADDAPGMTLSFGADNFSIPVMWIRADEGETANNAKDVDYLIVAPSFSAGAVSINPYLLYVYSDNAELYGGTSPALPAVDDLNMFYAGLDLNMSFDAASFWLTGIYNGGDADLAGSDNSVDFKGYLAALGGKFNFGMGDVHGQIFYATGDDEDGSADEVDAFVSPHGSSYYWSEIMGYGMFDDRVSKNSPADEISDILAANLGVTLKPMPKLALSLDVWHARKDDDIKISVDTSDDDDKFQSNLSESELGTEINLGISYQLIDNLKLDVVGAYLFAGEATTGGVEDEADPYEIGSRISLSF
jgi:hypothetical protein